MLNQGHMETEKRERERERERERKWKEDQRLWNYVETEAQPP